MKKTRHLIVLVAGLVTVLGSGGWLWHSRYADKPLNCIGNMEWNIGSNRFTGTLSFRMYNSEGPPLLPANCTGVIPQTLAGTSILTTPKSAMPECYRRCRLSKPSLTPLMKRILTTHYTDFTAKADEA